MMKKGLAILTVLCLFTFGFTFGLAEEEAHTDVGALTFEELNNWVETIVAQTKTEELLNDPAQMGSSESQIYPYIYQSATLYYNTPTLTEESQLVSVEVMSELTPMPRNIQVEGSQDALLSAYANENEKLYGSNTFALLYANNSLPDELLWARIVRNGQNVYGAEFTVHEKVEGTENYTYSGLYYTLSEGMVVGISAFGLNKTITLEEVNQNIQMSEELKNDTSYFAYPVSALGTDLEPFNREDMVFGGIDYIGITPETAVEVFGQPTFDEFFEDGQEWMQVYQWEGIEMVFSYDNSKNLKGVDSVSIDGVQEGPRGVKVGDSLSSVIKRFKFGEGGVEGQVETLYGQQDGEEYGVAEYDLNGDAVVRYVTTLEENGNKEQVMLYLSFYQGLLADILISNL